MEKNGTDFSDFRIPSLNMEAMMAAHRKNMEALSQAQETATDLFRSLTKMNAQYFKQLFDDLGGHMRKAYAGGMEVPSFDAVQERMKDTIRRNSAHYKGVSDLLNESGAKIFDAYIRHMKETLPPGFKGGNGRS